MDGADGKNCSNLRHLRLEENGRTFFLFLLFFFIDFSIFKYLFGKVHDNIINQIYRFKVLGKLVLQFSVSLVWW